MRVRYPQRAIEDLQDIFAYIAKENPFAASRVTDRIESVVAELGDIPGMGSPTDKQGIQRFPVSCQWNALSDFLRVSKGRDGHRSHSPWREAALGRAALSELH